MKAASVVNLLAVAALCLVVVPPPASASEADERPSGKIYLVGMGPGDPDLATVRAVQVINRADRVFCSSFLSQVVKPLARPDAVEEVSGLGKRFYGWSWRRRHLPEGWQPEAAEVNRAAEAKKRFEAFAVRVRELVASGKTVAIVDGGDPLIFGGLAWVTEEFDDLPLEVVPGVSSFNAANAALKRDIMWGGRACVVLSGGFILGVPSQDGQMTTPSVFFTHRVPLREIVARLLDQYAADTPVAIVCNAGCADRQEIIRATLGTIWDELSGRELPRPHIVYVGDILTLKHKD